MSSKKAALSATRKRIPGSIKVRHKSILFFFKHTLSPALFTKYISFIKELSLLQGMTITGVLTTLLCSSKKKTKITTIILLSATANGYKVIGRHYVAKERRKMAGVSLLPSVHNFCEAATKMSIKDVLYSDTRWKVLSTLCHCKGMIRT